MFLKVKYGVTHSQCNNCIGLKSLLGGRHKEGRRRGTGPDPASMNHRKGEGRIAVNVVLNTGI